ncbi:hypothetical protein [Granulicella tundricola]|uniref:Uncharacterized protein n=1 Tax=Granulicella tundricola (strain ATCC BAA-1859 / DSM 23138 / MP5ACTX9) TaxID=1198114 RepID=E8X4Z7_GRATM|nr:hypothetical protein [Granulicella tundricola]ADW67189.1 hypothetical protein AciX9_0104 [Granulicella tundricola MP5ACTX9]
MWDLLHPVYSVQAVTSSTKRGTLINVGNRDVIVHQITYNLTVLSPDDPKYANTADRDPTHWHIGHVHGTFLLNESLGVGHLLKYENKADAFKWADIESLEYYFGGAPDDHPVNFWEKIRRKRKVAALFGMGAVVDEVTFFDLVNHCYVLSAHAISDPEYQSRGEHHNATFDSMDTSATIEFYPVSPNSNPQVSEIPSIIDVISHDNDRPDTCKKTEYGSAQSEEPE